VGNGHGLTLWAAKNLFIIHNNLNIHLLSAELTVPFLWEHQSFALKQIEYLKVHIFIMKCIFD